MRRLAEPSERHEPAARSRAVVVATAFAAGLIGGSAFAQTPPAQFTPGPVVVIEADAVDERNDSNIVIAEGRVEVRYEGRTLRAERVIYDRVKRSVRAQGGVQIIEADGSVRTASELEVDDDLAGGVAIQFATRLADGATLASGSAVRDPNGTTVLSDVVFTACPVCTDEEDPDPPTWSLRAARAVQDPERQLIQYRGLALNFRGVPVAYFPVFAHADPSAGRRSGFLVPSLARSNRLGVEFGLPYYWVISPHSDVTITPVAYEKANPLIGVEYRRAFYSGSLQLAGSVTHESLFDNEGEKLGRQSTRGHVFGQGDFRIDDFWSWGFGVERSSDDQYLARYRLDYPEPRVGKYKGDISRLLSQANVTGQNSRTYVTASTISVQGLRPFDDSNTLPIVAPYAEAHRVINDPLFDGALTLSASSYNLLRSDERRDAARISVGAEYRVERTFGPGLVASPFAHARADYYRNEVNGAAETVGRTLGVAGFELRWPLIRPGHVTTIVEPIISAAVASGDAREGNVANEDSQAFEYDDTALWRINAAPNFDLWEPGSRITAGVRAQTLFDGGSGRLEIGRRWRSEAEPAFAPSTNLGDSSSDYVGVIGLDFTRPFSAGANVRFRMDDEDYALRRVDANVRAAIWRLTAGASYFRVDEDLRPGLPNEEVTASLGLRLSRHWSAFGTLRRDLVLDRNLSNSASLLYRDDCTFVEFTYERRETFDRLIGPEEGVSVRIGLSTIGGRSLGGVGAE